MLIGFIAGRDVETVEYFPLPAPYKVSRFRVCFRFQLLSSKYFRFHIPAPCFMKNASAFGSAKSQMIPSSLLASLFKVLPLPQKFNRFYISDSKKYFFTQVTQANIANWRSMNVRVIRVWMKGYAKTEWTRIPVLAPSVCCLIVELIGLSFFRKLWQNSQDKQTAN